MHFIRPGFDTLGLQHNLGLQWKSFSY
jgi:hypothetical protein